MQTTPGKRQRRQRGSINPEDIISGAFELAQQVSIDNLSMPLLGKHLRVGVTSIYWYFRKKDDLLNAMTDRALSKYVFATPYIEAGDWRETLRNHARSMRKTFADNPVLCDLILIRAALSPKTARLGAQEMEKAIANLVTAGLSLEDAFDIYSAVSVHVRGSVVLDRLSRKSQSAGSGPSAIEHPVAIDPATTPLLAHATGRGHRIGAPDETNFEYGLECILDHAGRLIEQSSKAAGLRHGGTLPGERRKNSSTESLPFCDRSRYGENTLVNDSVYNAVRNPKSSLTPTIRPRQWKEMHACLLSPHGPIRLGKRPPTSTRSG